MTDLTIRPATPADAALIMSFVAELAEYERLSHAVEAREADITRDLFGPQPRVFCDIAEAGGEPIGFALWFYNYSTFKGRHGIYLEDLFVRPTARGNGAGKALLRRLDRPEQCLAGCLPFVARFPAAAHAPGFVEHHQGHRGLIAGRKLGGLTRRAAIRPRSGSRRHGRW